MAALNEVKDIKLPEQEPDHVSEVEPSVQEKRALFALTILLYLNIAAILIAILVWLYNCRQMKKTQKIGVSEAVFERD